MPNRTLLAVRAMVAIALAWCVAVPAAVADERIVSFVAEIALNADGSVDVIETLDAVTDGSQIKHGIFRDLYTGVTGTNTLPAVVTVTGVERDGVTEPFAIEPEGNITRVRIGDADVLIEPGPHRFVVRYHMTNIAQRQSAYDALSWEVIGRWPFAMETVKAIVTLPEQATFLSAIGGTVPASEGQPFMVKEAGGKLEFTPGRLLDVGATFWIHVAIAKGALNGGTAI